MFYLGRITMRYKAIINGLAGLVLLSCFSGCDSTPLDPTDIGRWRPVPVVNVILDSLGVVDEPAGPFANSEDPLPSDVLPLNKDYVFGASDIIRVGIFELRQQGVPTLENYVVMETGRISIPDVGIIQAAGLTEPELEAELKDILSPDILVDPSVSVSLARSQSLSFSISGDGIARASRFDLPRYDFRLLDAIALAGGMAEFNVSNIYITRQVQGIEGEFGEFQTDKATGQRLSPSDENGAGIPGFNKMKLIPAEPGNRSPEEDILEIIAPHARRFYDGQHVMTSAELATIEELTNIAAPKGFPVESVGMSNEIEMTKPDAVSDAAQIEWVFENGKWTPVAVGGKASDDSEPEIISRKPAVSKREPATAGSYGWDEIGRGGQKSRVIKIPRDRLYGGDERYNVIIRPGDVITIPEDIVGEFYVMGHLNRQGPVLLTGRPITLKQAISAAGGLNAEAWPKKVEVVRRIGRNKEVTVLVDLNKIAKGLQPDFFIKPNDWINVGTHVISDYLAVLRSSFRATHGFGFVYDRNFVEPGNYPNFDPIQFQKELF